MELLFSAVAFISGVLGLSGFPGERESSLLDRWRERHNIKRPKNEKQFEF